jgi:hypothetical protein
MWSDPQRCEHCGAADSRDAAHSRGCPRLPPTSKERLHSLAQACERGWERLARRRTAAAPAVQAARAREFRPPEAGEGERVTARI